MKPPKPEDFDDLDGLVYILVINYVDDTSQNTTALEHVINEVDEACEKQMISDCKKLCLCLNEDKTKRLVIDMKDKQNKVSTEFLGAQINTLRNSHDEIEEFKKHLNKICAATKACSSLTKPYRMFISCKQIFSRMHYLPFMYVYASDTKREELRKSINLTFKKASYLSIRAPTEWIENYLYGMDFHSYCKKRLSKVFCSMEKDGNPILQGARQARGIWREDPKLKPGRLISEYCKFKNTILNYSPALQKNIKNESFKKLIKFKNDW